MFKSIKKNILFSYLTNLHFKTIHNFNLYCFCILYLILLTITNTFFIIDSNIIIFITFTSFLFLGSCFISNSNITNIMEQGFINHVIFNLLDKIILLLISFRFFIKIKYIQYNLDQIQFTFKLLNNIYYLMKNNLDRHIIMNNLAHNILLFNSTLYFFDNMIDNETNEDPYNIQKPTNIIDSTLDDELIKLFNNGI